MKCAHNIKAQNTMLIRTNTCIEISSFLVVLVPRILIEFEQKYNYMIMLLHEWKNK